MSNKQLQSQSQSFFVRYRPTIVLSLCSIFALVAVIYPHKEQVTTREVMRKNALRDIEQEKNENQQLTNNK